jgi:hypothetical protein
MGTRARCPAGHGGHGRERALRDDAEAPAFDMGVDAQSMDGVARAHPRVPAHRAGGGKLSGARATGGARFLHGCGRATAGGAGRGDRAPCGGGGRRTRGHSKQIGQPDGMEQHIYFHLSVDRFNSCASARTCIISALWPFLCIFYSLWARLVGQLRHTCCVCMIAWCVDSIASQCFLEITRQTLCEPSVKASTRWARTL